MTSHGVHELHVHLLAAVPNASYLEVHGFATERFVRQPPLLESGAALPPTAPATASSWTPPLWSPSATPDPAAIAAPMPVPGEISELREELFYGQAGPRDQTAQRSACNLSMVRRFGTDSVAMWPCLGHDDAATALSCHLRTERTKRSYRLARCEEGIGPHQSCTYGRSATREIARTTSSAVAIVARASALGFTGW